MSEMEKKIIFNEDVIYVHPENLKGFLPKSTPMPKKKTLIVNVDGVDITVILKGGKAIENKFDSLVELAGYTLETAQYYWLSRSEAIELAYKKDPNDHYGIEEHTFAKMSDDAPYADEKIIKMRVDFLRDVYKLIANDNALIWIAHAAEKKKNKTLYKGRYVNIAFSGLLTSYDYNAIEIVAKAKDDNTLEIYPETRAFSQEEYEKIENDIFSSAAKDYNNIDKAFTTVDTSEIIKESKKSKPQRTVKKKPSTEKEHEKMWLDEYTEHFESDPEIIIQGSVFVFSGLHYGTDDYFEEYILEKGGTVCNRINDDTNYFIVRPRDYKDTTIQAAIVQKQKRDNIHIMLISDFVRAVADQCNDDLLLRTFNTPVPEDRILLTENDGDYEYKTDRAKIHATIIDYIGSDLHIVVPKTMNGIPVTKINSPFEVRDDSWFIKNADTKEVMKSRAKIETIIIPDSVRTIGSFMNCKSLKYICLPSKLEYIGIGTFNGCSELRSIFIPDSVKSIHQSAFKDCTSLTNVYLSEGFTNLRTLAFDIDRFPNLVIHGPDNGYIKRFAEKNNLPFVLETRDRKTIEEQIYAEAMG